MILLCYDDKRLKTKINVRLKICNVLNMGCCLVFDGLRYDIHLVRM
jgi:hypothetical protein